MTDAARVPQGERLCARCRGLLEGHHDQEAPQRHCVKCGLGWKPLDGHGRCDRCAMGV